MFTKTNRNENEKPEVVLPKVPVAPSLLSSDLTIIGDLNSTGEVQIDGTFTGDIKVDTLILGATANVVGEVFANSVSCLLYTSPSPRDLSTSRMPSSA